MTEAEELRSEIRELKMRLREVRTENAELKILQKRWLTLSTIVSVLSLFFAFLMVFISGDIKIERSYNQARPSAQEEIYPLSNSKTNRIEVNLDAPEIEPEFVKPKVTDSFLDAPALDFEDEIEQNPTPVSAKEPIRGGAFELPGMESGSKRKVIQYVVKKNDTLWNIARKMMGSSKTSNINKIMKDNGLTDSRLDPGMSLVIIIDP